MVWIYLYICGDEDIGDEWALFQPTLRILRDSHLAAIFTLLGHQISSRVCFGSTWLMSSHQFIRAQTFLFRSSRNSISTFSWPLVSETGLITNQGISGWNNVTEVQRIKTLICFSSMTSTCMQTSWMYPQGCFLFIANSKSKPIRWMNNVQEMSWST